MERPFVIGHAPAAGRTSLGAGLTIPAIKAESSTERRPSSTTGGSARTRVVRFVKPASMWMSRCLKSITSTGNVRTTASGISGSFACGVIRRKPSKQGYVAERPGTALQKLPHPFNSGRSLHAGSFNGRTTVSGIVDEGSIPSPATSRWGVAEWLRHLTLDQVFQGSIPCSPSIVGR